MHLANCFASAGVDQVLGGVACRGARVVASQGRGSIDSQHQLISALETFVTFDAESRAVLHG